jgi:hypothetical protein
LQVDDMKKLLFALGVALWLCAPAHAQVVSAYTVSACGAQSNPAGQSFPLTMDLKGNLCESPSNTSAAPLYVVDAGTTGLDYSANKPTLPNVGANFAASGPYASYILITTVPASATRNSVDIENTSGAQIAIIRDDGTAAAAAAPVNASVFALGGGSGAGAQGGAWSSQTFKGRLQIYSASSAAQVAVMVE